MVPPLNGMECPALSFFVAKLVNKKYPTNVSTHICKDLRSVCTSDRYFIQHEANRPLLSPDYHTSYIDLSGNHIPAFE